MASPAFAFQPEDSEVWLAHLRTEGFVIIRGVIDQDAVLAARSGLEAIVNELAEGLLASGAVADVLQDRPFETRFWELFRGCPEEMPLLLRPELHQPEFFPLLCNPRLLDAVRVAVPAAELRIFPNYTCRPKTPSPQHDVVWHQDAALRSDGMPNEEPEARRIDAFGDGACVNCWTPLVPATAANGAMRFIPRSHREGILRHELIGSYGEISGIDVAGKHPGGTTFGKYATGVNAHDVLRLQGGAVDIECGVGDVVLFSQFLVHRGGQNSTEQIRWSFDWRFQDTSKSTCRELEGHIIFSETDASKVVATAEQWGRHALV